MRLFQCFLMNSQCGKNIYYIRVDSRLFTTKGSLNPRASFCRALIDEIYLA